MDTETIIKNFHDNKIISKDIIDYIQDNEELRIDMINYFRHQKNRDFAINFLETTILIRERTYFENCEMDANTIMLACYILGLHNQIEDCLKIWEAKTIDFDTHCGLDIQLIAFAGIEKTIEFLKNQTEANGIEAFEYVSECLKAGDFDNLKEEYFSEETIPWFV